MTVFGMAAWRARHDPEGGDGRAHNRDPAQEAVEAYWTQAPARHEKS